MPKSCIDCTFVRNCNHAATLALQIVLQVRSLERGMPFFEVAAATCKVFTGSKPRRRDPQLRLALK